MPIAILHSKLNVINTLVHRSFNLSKNFFRQLVVRQITKMNSTTVRESGYNVQHTMCFHFELRYKDCRLSPTYE